MLVLTQEEAWELLSRCLNSSDPDNETSKALLKKLAKILQSSHMDSVKAA